MNGTIGFIGAALANILHFISVSSTLKQIRNPDIRGTAVSG